MISSEEIKEKVKQFILQEFLPDENPDDLDTSTELITTGVLDSISTLKLASFLEEQFQVQLEAHEMDVENLNTIDSIAALVQNKQDG